MPEDTLLSYVHPADWTNPTPRERYDLVVLGAGTAGLVTAAGAAGLGAKVALVERDRMGGDCLNVGCVPSKAIIAAARIAANARRAGEYGIIAGDVRVDFPFVMERMRRLRASLAPHDSAARFGSLGIDVFFGEARFVSDDAVDVEAKHVALQASCDLHGSAGGDADNPRPAGDKLSHEREHI